MTTKEIITYRVEVPSELEHLRNSFAYWVDRTLSDHRKGIPALWDVEYERRKDPKATVDIVAKLTSQEDINRECGFENLSCSIMKPAQSDEPDEILFSLENWLSGAQYNGPINDYRKYLVNHEFLHCRPFRFDHPTMEIVGEYCSAASDAPLPVMYQQSKGVPFAGCKHNPWPLSESESRVWP